MIFNKQLADGNRIYSRCQILFVRELDFTIVEAGVQPRSVPKIWIGQSRCFNVS